MTTKGSSITVYHETFVAENFRGFHYFSYHRKSLMPSNLHHRHNPLVYHKQPRTFYDATELQKFPPTKILHCTILSTFLLGYALLKYWSHYSNYS